MNMKNLIAILILTALALTSRGADYGQTVGDLIPKLANPNVGDRYDAQMQLQEIASQSSQPGNATEREALGKVLAAKAADGTVPQPARVWIVRQLEYMGGEEAVAALTQLMNGSDPELSECARRALEKNPAPAAGASLRAALEKAGEARWKIGLINSLGQRQDTEAIRLIAPLAGHFEEAQVSAAAMLALGKIATGEATSELIKLLLKSQGKSVPATEALITTANRMAAKGGAAAAREIYRTLSGPAYPPATRAAGLSGLIKCTPETAGQILGDALTEQEPRIQQAALTAATSVLGQALTPTLVPLLAKLNPTAKAQALGVLDTSAEKQVIEAVDDTNEIGRRAALEALGRIGGAASVPVLIKAALDDSKPGKTAAEAALARLPGDAAAASLQQAAGDGDAKSRVVAINVLSTRRHFQAIPEMFKYAAETDPSVRKAAYSALRNMSSDGEIERLAMLVLAGKTEAGPALEAAAQHAVDKPAAVKKLVILASKDETKLAALAEPLSALGGDEALAVFEKLTASSNADIQNDAVRALGNWPDFAAAKPLLAIAENKEAKLNQYVLAMQGIVRLVKSVETETPDKRVELALAAMNAAKRDAEKKLALSALASVPHRKAAAALKPLLNDPALKKEACAAAISLAESLVRPDKRTAKDLATAIQAATEDQDILRRAARVLSR